jgi:hypothetical protein
MSAKQIRKTWSSIQVWYGTTQHGRAQHSRASSGCVRYNPHPAVFADVFEKREDLDHRRWIDRDTRAWSTEVTMPACQPPPS